MKLHCLGTAGYHPSEDRHTSCYFLPNAGLVLDAGTGIFRLPELIETDWLDILLTHAHLDHVVGLTYLLDILSQRPVDMVRVWGEADKLASIQKHLFAEHLFPIVPDVQWNAIDGDSTVHINDMVSLQTFALPHPSGSLGFRIELPDRSMAYITDTTADVTADYVKKIRDVDLLLHECNFRFEQREWAIKTGHSSAGDVGKVAVAVDAAQTWIVHINPLETSDDPVGINHIRSGDLKVGIAVDKQVIEF